MKETLDATLRADLKEVTSKAMRLSNDTCHNGFPLDLNDHKNKKESPPIFSVRV